MLERDIERGVRLPVDCGLFDWEAGGEAWEAAMVEGGLAALGKNTKSPRGTGCLLLS